MKWSETVQDYYPVEPRARWGHGQPRHTQVRAVLERSREVFRERLALIDRHKGALAAVPHARPTPLAAWWGNAGFSCLDAAALVAFLLERNPPRYVEIGSGNSTMFARHAIRHGGLQTHITSIDPQPRAEIDSISDTIIRRQLEQCDVDFVDELRPGDILFFDGSHRAFPNSDVTVFFLEILPRLKPGVLVHVHDIFLPDDYPPPWRLRMYSEQYMLAAMLLCPALPFRVILPNYFACTDPELSETVHDIFRDGDIPFTYKNDVNCPGVSFWFEML